MIQIALACFALFFAHNAVSGFLPQGSVRKENPAVFTFAEVKYFHRYTKDDQREYTPDGQENLNAWKDMVTLNLYPQVKNGESLAATASAVLETYRANRAIVVKTDSVPRSVGKPAEHLIVVIFGRPDFIEVAFARFRMHDGLGSAVIYSHRIYGQKVGDVMSAWLERNGAATERNLMKWDGLPKSPAAARAAG